jgi:hypothetical protein
MKQNLHHLKTNFCKDSLPSLESDGTILADSSNCNFFIISSFLCHKELEGISVSMQHQCANEG